MNSTEPVIFDQPIKKISRVGRVTGALLPLVSAIECIIVAKGGFRLIGWYMFLPVIILGVVYLITLRGRNAQLTITRSSKGELHLLVADQKMILQGTPSSFYNWSYIQHRFLPSGAHVHLIEVKTTYGETLGLISEAEYAGAGDLETRNVGLSGDYPTYKIADINPLIEVLESNGIQFSYK